MEEAGAIPSVKAREATSRRGTRKPAKEQELVEEKVLTPSRRSARIRSNTSLVSETTQLIDSPRARRAARRNSQIDSDTEAPLTPIRQTRRTRKGSISSVDKPIETITTSKINDTIIEEQDTNVEKDTSTPILRKSPRLKGQKSIKENIEVTNDTNIDNDNTEDNIGNRNISIQTKGKILDLSDNQNDDVKLSDPNSALTYKENNEIISTILDVSNDEKENLSVSSSNLLKSMNMESKKIRDFNNKSTSNLFESHKTKTKKHRTMSFTAITGKCDKEASFLSDNESVKKKVKDKLVDLIGSKSSGDSLKIGKEKRKDNSETKLDTSLDNKVNSNTEKEVTAQPDCGINCTSRLLQKEPSEFEISLVFDSDSNSLPGKKDTNKNVDNGGQCVPVIDSKANTTVEPMDIDETIPGNISIQDMLQNDSNHLSINYTNKSKLKSSHSLSQKNGNVNTATKSTMNVLESSENKIVISEEIKEVDLNKVVEDTTNVDEKTSRKSKRKPSESSTMETDVDKQTSISKTNSSNITFQEKSVNDSSNSMKKSFNITTEDLSDSKHKSKIFKKKSSIVEESEDNIVNKKHSDKNLIIENDNKAAQIKKSSPQLEPSDNIDKSTNENKTTLILSQIKDTSQETSHLSKSPNLPKDKFLSKSTDTPDIIKGKDYDKNISLTNLTTSTPLQKKPFIKLGLPADTSHISPKDNKSENRSTSRKETSVMQSVKEMSDSDGSESEVESENDSNMIDDKAENAGDDYESGDSRDESEKEYEDDNEIVEQGETLDTEEEISDDSEYEKDSFVVSSDEEDEELLSGSGDDLSLSDNELTLSKKSKKKYNDRKVKEQKKASKEMYLARHEHDADNNKAKGNKSNRRRIESSLISTDDETFNKNASKKKKYMVINSTMDTSHNDSQSYIALGKSKRKKNRLSESICNESVLNEKEITACLSNDIEIDPLVQAKEELKTPQKDFNISTVDVKEGMDIEEVKVDENISILKLNETSDPLQVTMAENGDSSMSENEEIKQNYDSVLNNLSSIQPKQKYNDILLNADNKSKKVKFPIFDELNLTQVESRNNKPHQLAKVSNKFESVISEESSSNSIDMKLLFPEDSNDSEVNTNAFKFKPTKKSLDATQNYIPIKKSEGATDISIDSKNVSVSEADVSRNKKKKNKNQKLSSEQSQVEVDTKEGEVFGFFIDTKGAQIDIGISVNTSKTKKQKTNTTLDSSENEHLNISTLYTNDNITDNIDLTNEAPIEVSFTKKKKKEKCNLDSSQATFEEGNTDWSNEAPLEVSLTKKNKKGKRNADSSQLIIEEEKPESSEAPLDVSVTKKKKNKEKVNPDISPRPIHEDTSNEAPLEVSFTKKKNKEKRISESTPSKMDEDIPGSFNESPTEVSFTKKKKKDKQNADSSEPRIIEDEIPITNIEDVNSSNKKRKRKPSDSAPIEAANLQVEELKIEESQPISKKKKRKLTGDDPIAEKTDDHNKSEQNEVKNNKKLNVEQESTLKPESGTIEVKKNKKRKYTENDDTTRNAKIPKRYFTDDIHVPRLPETIINKLSDKPKSREMKAISTTPFIVEEVPRRQPKPSNYLEESVYLNESPKPKKQKYSFKNVKVLPFVPTATTSYKGFTTDFKVNILEEDTRFIAQASSSHNFKNNYLQDKRIKKLGTLEKYKQSRNTKLSKF